MKKCLINFISLNCDRRIIIVAVERENEDINQSRSYNKQSIS